MSDGSGHDTTAQAAIWLIAMNDAHTAPLQILVDELNDHLPRPVAQVMMPAAVADLLSDVALIEQFFHQNNVAVMVLMGDALPVKLIERAQAAGVHLVLVEANSPAPLGRWKMLPGATRAALRHFGDIHAMSPVASAALQRVVKSGPNLHETGALARFAPALPCNMSELDAMKQSLRARPVWLSYAPVEAEVAPILSAHANALRRAHRLLLVVQPKDPALGEALARRAQEAGFACARRSLEEDVAETTQVYIADGGDEAGLFLRLASVAVLGGTLTPGARSSDPIAAAALGSALIFGVHIQNESRDFLTRLRKAGAGHEIADAAELGGALSNFLSPEVGAQAALRAWTLATEGAEATSAVAEAICNTYALREAAL